ncbi:MAG: LON peptidase substrate-binding domain-containing protein, partial [Rhizobiales bacterium]|nr:LON peptidase substrate-binding domain-containing protein [Hyphomicrobiales bacterium]
MAGQVGNKRFEGIEDIPSSVPIFPLTGALLLPKGQMPLNIFEPRYIAMVDAALSGDRLIGMIQPIVDGNDPTKTQLCGSGKIRLCTSGCL